LRLRLIKFVREQFFLAAAAQNFKRLVRFLSPPTAPQLSPPRKEEKNSVALPRPAQDRSKPEFFNTHA